MSMSTPAAPDPHHRLPANGPLSRPALEAPARAAMPTSRLAGWLLLAVPAIVFLAEPFFVDHGAVGRSTSFRDAPLALFVGLAALRIVTSQGRQLIAPVVAGAAGAGLLLSAILAPHDHVGVTVTEAVCGVFTIILAVVAGMSSD
ncbi:hypothetical protein ncot_11400 [Nocardioides sp. JQ2195]|uniref:hypothetical protein n=1 Tax=Nocardioides sp. JQ2195 TaxID=2592334 RepID=UPI00143EEF61|nr:hypothetical protein [Nocardioides sp. JQ2195]QIX27135.1 hypothetical protein ncot_11400 [Nocardioides sp. JQ2195]